MKNPPTKIPISSKWMKFAEDDLKTAMILWETDSKLYRIICYHSQQYVEKILKGIIEAHHQIPPKIHDVNALANRCFELGVNFPLSKKEVYFLSSVYIDTRYPPDIGLLPEGEPGEKEAELCMRILNKVKDWLERGKKA